MQIITNYKLFILVKTTESEEVKYIAIIIITVILHNTINNSALDSERTKKVFKCLDSSSNLSNTIATQYNSILL